MKGEKLVQHYLDAVIERNSYIPQEGEEQTPARKALLLLAQARVKTTYGKLNGSMIAEAKRRLTAQEIPNV